MEYGYLANNRLCFEAILAEELQIMPTNLVMAQSCNAFVLTFLFKRSKRMDVLNLKDTLFEDSMTKSIHRFGNTFEADYLCLSICRLYSRWK